MVDLILYPLNSDKIRNTEATKIANLVFESQIVRRISDVDFDCAQDSLVLVNQLLLAFVSACVPSSCFQAEFDRCFQVPVKPAPDEVC